MNKLFLEHEDLLFDQLHFIVAIFFRFLYLDAFHLLSILFACYSCNSAPVWLSLIVQLQLTVLFDSHCLFVVPYDQYLHE